ncbi:tetratricopeptide repeat protein [bacterium]|nr:tetratricopeptide repeat protein [bacterium]
MSILGKLFSAPAGAGKLAPKIKAALKLLEQSKHQEALAQFRALWAEKGDAPAEADLALLRELRSRLLSDLIRRKEFGEALPLAAAALEDDPAQASAVATEIVDSGFCGPESFDIIRKAVAADAVQKNLMLKTAKAVLAERQENLGEADISFLTDTARSFPLWKDGVTLLADRYLKEGRRDSESLAIYRAAYPNRKADRRLREVLLDSMIAVGERDDFAASVYLDAVETGSNPEALRLLAEIYIGRGDLSIPTVPYIQLALEKGADKSTPRLSDDSLKRLAALVLAGNPEQLDRLKLLQLIFRLGYYDRDMLSFMSDSLAEQGKFDDLSIKVMSLAFEQRLVTKRAVLILSEHCLANERDDEFAIRVYETYLSTWPDRPQRRIYYVLAQHYAGLTRVDDQAQKIYEEALVDNPTDPVISTILARAYHAADRRDETAEEIYRGAFAIADNETKQQLGRVLAEIRVSHGDFSQETLLYLTTCGKPSSGPLAKTYDEALTNCFLAAGRRGEQAQQAYFALFERTENTPDINPRLVRLLSEIIKERGAPPESNTVEMRVYRKVFDLEKFSTDPEVAAVLLEDSLRGGDGAGSPVQLGVLVFEHKPELFIDTVTRYKREHLLQEVGDFYIERHNFPLAAQAYQASFNLQPTDAVRYRLVKIHLLEGQPDKALEHLQVLNVPGFEGKRAYWQAAAFQQKHEPVEAGRLLRSVPQNDGVPQPLIDLRWALNDELDGNLEGALHSYTELLKEPALEKFQRWMRIERGIVMLKLGRLEAARDQLEEIWRQNPNGRAEQLFLSLALFFLGHRSLKEGKVAEALPLMTHAVEVNRNHRLLRQVIVDVLDGYGEEAFFKGDLKRAADLLDTAQRILPKRIETKILLAYTYHRLKDYAKAIINYRDIVWSDENPWVQRSQAYAYMEHNQPDKAWKVLIDLARRGNLSNDDFPRFVKCYLADPEVRESHNLDHITFNEGCDGPGLVAVLLHDGLYDRAAELLGRLVQKSPDDPQLYWYLGQAHSHLGKREMAVHYWKQLLDICKQRETDPALKLRQFTEIGLAFLNAGYAQEAIQTWAELRTLDERNPDLPVLYAGTLDLNAYQAARKDQLKQAREEWKKALEFDPENPWIVQNYAISILLLDDLDEAGNQYKRLARLWMAQVNKNPRANAHLARWVSLLERALSTFALTKNRPDHDLTKIRAEDTVGFYQKANQFYWILSLDKRANLAQIEREYFRLIKIFNPERHADDFMLVEESYTHLFKSQERRELLNIFAFNPLDLPAIRSRLSKVPQDGSISFERLDLPSTIPPPDFQQLKPQPMDEAAAVRPLDELMAISFKIPDWTIL